MRITWDGVVVELVGVADQADLLQELVDGEGEVSHRAHQLGQVLQAPFRLDRALGVEGASV